jgi:hypothetical protein
MFVKNYVLAKLQLARPRPYGKLLHKDAVATIISQERLSSLSLN